MATVADGQYGFFAALSANAILLRGSDNRCGSFLIKAGASLSALGFTNRFQPVILFTLAAVGFLLLQLSQLLLEPVWGSYLVSYVT